MLFYAIAVPGALHVDGLSIIDQNSVPISVDISERQHGFCTTVMGMRIPGGGGQEY